MQPIPLPASPLKGEEKIYYQVVGRTRTHLKIGFIRVTRFMPETIFEKNAFSSLSLREERSEGCGGIGTICEKGGQLILSKNPILRWVLII
jgi:hypothetical protein